MCGRFALVTEKHILEIIFELEIRVDLQSRLNIAPSEQILVIRQGSEGKRESSWLKWGLLPYWSKGENQLRNLLINARTETADQKPTFRDAFRRRRLLIPASGFFEWKNTGSGKQPYYIRMKNKAPFALGGLWDRWPKVTPLFEGCAILTVSANEKVAPIHDRMPLIIPPTAYKAWLSHETGLEEIKKLATPYPAAVMEAVPLPDKVFKTGRILEHISKEL